MIEKNGKSFLFWKEKVSRESKKFFLVKQKPGSIAML
jgi:hypothetical protein